MARGTAAVVLLSFALFLVTLLPQPFPARKQHAQVPLPEPDEPPLLPGDVPGNGTLPETPTLPTPTVPTPTARLPPASAPSPALAAVAVFGAVALGAAGRRRL